MPYTTTAELSDRYGQRMLVQLTDRASPPVGAIDQAVIDREIANAGAVIDGYLAGRYALPLAETPPLLADLAQAIAIYKLHPATPEAKIKDDYDTALRQLQAIASGMIKLAVAGIEAAGSGSAGVEVVDRERPFTPENLVGFI